MSLPFFTRLPKYRLGHLVLHKVIKDGKITYNHMYICGVVVRFDRAIKNYSLVTYNLTDNKHSTVNQIVGVLEKDIFPALEV